MATLNVSMPDELRAFIEARVNTGEYQSASDYLRDLIRHDLEEIDRHLTEGIENGKATPLDMPALQKKGNGNASQRARQINAQNPDKVCGGRRFDEHKQAATKV